VLHEAFFERYERMLDSCLTGTDGDPGGLTHRLSASESKCATRASPSRLAGPPAWPLAAARPRPADPPALTLPAPPAACLHPAPRAWLSDRRSVLHWAGALQRLPAMEGTASGAHHRVRRHKARAKATTVSTDEPEPRVRAYWRGERGCLWSGGLTTTTVDRKMLACDGSHRRHDSWSGMVSTGSCSQARIAGDRRASWLPLTAAANACEKLAAPAGGPLRRRDRTDASTWAYRRDTG
jgi:hypothetical protein